jgi:dimethylamine/trimethylamine dehydrogenase
MNTNPYSILFEPVKIGPKVTKNRFYQVPHCDGAGHLRPRTHAAMRRVKAEGGWGVISTQETEIHPTGDISPSVEQHLWDDADIPALRLMTDALRDEGALSAIELVHNGHHAANLMSRAVPLAPVHRTYDGYDPIQARAMDKQDIANLRGWHKTAVKRAKEAGFDIIYVYAGHNMSILHHFMLARENQRGDDYGGSLANRVRLTREMLEDAHDAVAGNCAIAFRFATDELLGADGMQASGEGRDVVEMLADLPDLWDVNVSGWSNDSATARFEPIEGYQENFTGFVKQVTNKPVVGVGRFTSPDAMVSQLKRGVLDLIGAARPSIADPFLPNKIEAGRLEDIRECIGCNICVAGDNRDVVMRCTQNPTVGEEWRRGWHPERIAPKQDDQPVLVVGAGPAGLECALQLARRGYPVTLAEASAQLGGRARREATLPGLSTWARVADYREQQLRQMANVEIYLDSKMTAAQIEEFGAAQVFLATGCRWRADGIGRQNRDGLPGLDPKRVYTPDDLLTGNMPSGRVLLYDDDHAYLGGVLAELLVQAGRDVVLVTPAAEVSTWTRNTLEQEKIQGRLIDLGVEIFTGKALRAFPGGGAVLACVYSGQENTVRCDSIVLVTERLPNEDLALALGSRDNVRSIGDCHAPGLIAHATYSGHLAAREYQQDPSEIEAALFRREMPGL